VEHSPIFNDIILPLCHDLASRLDIPLVTILLQQLVVVDDTLDERLLEIYPPARQQALPDLNHNRRRSEKGKRYAHTPMNNPRGLRCLGTLSYRPLPDFISARGEKAAQSQTRAHRRNDLRQRALRPQLLALLRGLLLGFEAGETLFEGYGEGEDGVAGGVFFDPFGDFGEMFVFLADVIFFAEVDEVDDWFCGEEKEGVYDFDLAFEFAGVSFLW